MDLRFVMHNRATTIWELNIHHLSMSFFLSILSVQFVYALRFQAQIHLMFLTKKEHVERLGSKLLEM
jgi:hypothetical protein